MTYVLIINYQNRLPTISNLWQHHIKAIVPFVESWEYYLNHENLSEKQDDANSR